MSPIPAQPAFDAQEYLERVEAVQRRLLERGVDAALLTRSDNIYYLTGYETENQFDYQLLVIPARGEPHLLILDFEAGRSENSGTAARVTMYRPSDDTSMVTVQFLGAVLADGSTVVVDAGPTEFLGPLRAAIGGISRLAEVPYELEVEVGRRSKSDAELGYLRQAARLTDLGIAAALAAAGPGVTDGAVAGAATNAMFSNGGQMVPWGPIVAVGYRAGTAHSSFNGQTIAEGDAVYLELTAMRRRYTSPLMRTAILGEPTPMMRRVEEHARAAIRRVMTVARAGVTAHEVAVAALSELEPVLDEVIYHYVVAYPVGIMFTTSWIERLGFLVMEGNHQPIPAGSVLHLPFSLRRYGEWGVNLSQTIVVTDSGAEALSETEAELVTIRPN